MYGFLGALGLLESTSTMVCNLDYDSCFNNSPPPMVLCVTYGTLPEKNLSRILFRLNESI